MEYLVLVVMMGGLTSLIAISKGRSGVGWFFFGAAFFFVAIIVLLVVGPLERCPKCGGKRSKSNFCPSCGAQLRLRS